MSGEREQTKRAIRVAKQIRRSQWKKAIKLEGRRRANERDARLHIVEVVSAVIAGLQSRL